MSTTTVEASAVETSTVSTVKGASDVLLSIVNPATDLEEIRDSVRQGWSLVDSGASQAEADVEHHSSALEAATKAADLYASLRIRYIGALTLTRGLSVRAVAEYLDVKPARVGQLRKTAVIVAGVEGKKGRKPLDHTTVRTIGSLADKVSADARSEAERLAKEGKSGQDVLRVLKESGTRAARPNGTGKAPTAAAVLKRLDAAVEALGEINEMSPEQAASLARVVKALTANGDRIRVVRNSEQTGTATA